MNIKEVILHDLAYEDNKKYKNLREFVDRKLTSLGSIAVDKVTLKRETSFQRIIFNSKNSVLKFRSGEKLKVSWYDIELPVVFGGSARRNSIDLIGATSISNFVLCELKYKNKYGGDPPKYALYELLSYFHFINLNHKSLDDNQVHHTNSHNKRWKWGKVVESPYLIIAANDEYWNYWHDHAKGKYIIEFWKSINEIRNSTKLYIHAFQVNKINPSKKSNNGIQSDFYSPEWIDLESFSTE